jgi:hypothetical protein
MRAGRRLAMPGSWLANGCAHNWRSTGYVKHGFYILPDRQFGRGRRRPCGSPTAQESRRAVRPTLGVGRGRTVTRTRSARVVPPLLASLAKALLELPLSLPTE